MKNYFLRVIGVGMELAGIALDDLDVLVNEHRSLGQVA